MGQVQASREITQTATENKTQFVAIEVPHLNLKPKTQTSDRPKPNRLQDIYMLPICCPSGVCDKHLRFATTTFQHPFQPPFSASASQTSHTKDQVRRAH